MPYIFLFNLKRIRTFALNSVFLYFKRKRNTDIIFFRKKNYYAGFNIELSVFLYFKRNTDIIFFRKKNYYAVCKTFYFNLNSAFFSKNANSVF